jgi:hypothetical protein
VRRAWGILRLSNGFYKRRRGIAEHVDAGLIDLLELGIHDYLNLKANLVIGNGWPYPAGVCVTSAVALHSLCGRRVSERTIQRILEKLERIGWIKAKPWLTPGKCGNYVVLICRASVHDLSGNEYRVNGAATMDWRHPIYEPVGQMTGNRRRTVAEVATLREVTEGRTKENKENKAPRRQKSAPGDFRFQPFFAFAFESFTMKHGRKPLWQGKDRIGLKNLLKNHSEVSLPLERLKTLWRNLLDSTEAFTVKQAGSLAYFCSNVDKFSDGPILATPGKGPIGYTKPTVGDNIRQTLEAFRLSEKKPIN